MSENENGNENQENQNNGGLDPERFSNFQKEMDRKLSNTNSQVEALLKSQQELVSTLSQSKQQKSQVNDQISELLYTDPDKAAELLRKQVASEVRSEINSENQANQAKAQKSQQVLSQLARKYPELNDASSSLSQKAVEIFESFSDEDKSNTAVAYRAAINEAVAELGIKDASKRKSGDDIEDYGDFIIGSSNSRSGSREKKPKLDPATIAFADAMGLNVDDKEVLKKLAKRAQRDYSKYR